jgi:hypothetical protein
MDWNEIFKIIGVTTGPQIILVIILGFSGKRLIEFFFAETVEIKKKELEQNLENHKQGLEQENRNLQLELDKNLESYKNRMEILRLEFQVQFAELHVKRSEIIATLYKYLTRLNLTMLEMTAPGHFVKKDADKEEQERLDNAAKAYLDFREYYIPNKIYFEPAVTGKLDNILNFFWDKAWNFNFIKERINTGQIGHEEWKQYSKELKEISSDVRTEAEKSLVELENEFRDLLGVNSRKIIEELKEKIKK